MLTFSVLGILTVKTSDESLPRTKQLRESVDIISKMISQFVTARHRATSFATTARLHQN